MIYGNKKFTESSRENKDGICLKVADVKAPGNSCIPLEPF